MMLRTHLAFAILAIILLVMHVQNQIIFILMVLIATYLPDVDHAFSSAGRNPVSRTFQQFVRHRGIVHSLTVGVAISVILSVYFPVASLGFFVGWAIHMLCDSFTKDGVQAFWPLKYKSSGLLATGGRIEQSLFYTMIIIDIAAFFLIIVF